MSFVAEPGAQRLAASGVRHGAVQLRRWQGAPQMADVYAARADAEAALVACGVASDGLQVLPPVADWYHPGRAVCWRATPNSQWRFR